MEHVEVAICDRRRGELVNDKEKISDRIHDRICVELQRQKENGKEFISDEKIDELVDKILKDEIHNKKVG